MRKLSVPGSRARGSLRAPGLLGWFRIVLVALAFAVGLTAAVLSRSGQGRELPQGLGAVAWFLLLAAGLTWLARLAEALAGRALVECAVCSAGALGHLMLLLGLAASRGLGGLLGVFGLFLAAGETVYLVELRIHLGALEEGGGRLRLPPRARLVLSWAALAAYLLLVPMSFR